MLNRHLRLFSRLIVIGAVSIIPVFHIVERFHSNRDVQKQDGVRQVIETTIARIDHASTLREIKTSTNSHRSLVQSPSVGRSEDAASRPLIDGYALSEFHGEMRKGVLEPDKHPPQTTSFPKFDWLEDPNSIETLIAHAIDAERDWSFGVVLVENGLTQSTLKEALESYDVEVVGSSGRLVRAKLPADRALLDSIVDLDGVASIATVPVSAKISEAGRKLFQSTPRESIPVFITLMGLDSDGHWRRSLETLGATVGHFDPTIRVYVAHATYDVIQKIAATDFVLAVEPVGIVEAMHDSAIPSMGADSLRTYDGLTGLFSGIGGASVPIAVMDTGLNRSHLDIASNRDSICGANFVFFDPLFDDTDLWIDEHGHGSHVTGTIVGNGTAKPKYAGFAPLVRHIRFAKVLSQAGFGTGLFIFRGMDYLKDPTACSGSGGMSEAVKPLIVNMSLSGARLTYDGRNVGARKLDAVVWEQNQLYVVSHANNSVHGFSNYGAGKNSLAIGAVRDDGALASFSSLGPTADGRLSPQVVGTGVTVTSMAGNGSRAGYETLSGTSMASPAVAGVAALVMDADSAFREQPALVRARLMASAIKADAWMEAPDAFRRDNSDGPGSLQASHGLGQVSARTSVLQHDQPNGWQNGSAVSVLKDGEYAFIEVDVVENTARLDVVLTWDEPPGDTLTNTVLNDLDLWIDHNADCASEPCGEYVSQSRIDNVEWIIVSNPEPGKYRLKVAATRIYTEAPRAALAWTMIHDVATPNLKINVDRADVQFENVADVIELTVSITSDAYVASGTRLHFDCRTFSERSCRSSRNINAVAVREDGVERKLENLRLGEVIEIGELAVGETWQAQLTFNALVENDVDAYRLYLKANAWNGNSDSTSVLVRTSASTESNTNDIAEPVNDDFADAKLIEGDIGDDTVDLLKASAEPAEPPFDPISGYPIGTVWYKWIASSNDKVSFGVTPSGSVSLDDEVRIDAFQGHHLAALDRVASAAWGIQFFPDTDQTYWIRISHLRRSTPLVLSWSVGPRPSNDRFIAAARLTGDEGMVMGTNSGATTETGESFGYLAASVWYRWEAPSDAEWRFMSEGSDLRVLVFSGDDVTNLRLVSGLPSNDAIVTARAGDVYYVAVMSEDSFSGGGSFELKWDKNAREPGNDDFEDAEEISSEASSYRVDIDVAATVEPGEPLATGIRTKWWVWTAPQDGMYTWRIDELTRTTSGSRNRMMLSVFTGSSFEDLQLVGSNAPRMAIEFKFDAIDGGRYWIAAGLPANDYWAFTPALGSLDATLVWGETPDHDEPHAAMRLAGLTGSVSGSSEFATNSIDERTDLFGRSTLWWTYEAEESGWFRFAVDSDDRSWGLTIHSNVDREVSDLTMLASDTWQRNENEIVFYARKGVVYTIGLGVKGSDIGGEFTLRWEPTDAPSWLRFVGQVVDGVRDSSGDFVSIRGSEDMVIHPDGRSLYLATDAGLQVFERDIETGEIEHIQLLENAVEVPFDTLIWDEPRARLLMHRCAAWYAVEPVDGGPLLASKGRVDSNSSGNCSFQLLMDDEGANIYSIQSTVIGHHIVDAEGIVSNAQRLNPNERTRRAVLANDGAYLYATTPVGIDVYEIDSDSGALTRTEYDEEPLDGSGGSQVPMIITDDDEFLIAFDNAGERANLFSLEDRTRPELLHTLTDFWETSAGYTSCRYANIRAVQELVDVFCNDLVFTLEIDREARELQGVTWINESTTDAFNNLVPEFDLPEGFAVSPDDRYLYSSSEDAGLIILSRDLTRVFDVSGPDLFVRTTIDDGGIYEPGASFDLRAVVRNRGDRMSDTSTLRFYRSDDALISTSDITIGNVAVSSIGASGQVTYSIGLTAPLELGRYYYGACVDEVTDESNVDNNCSAAVTMTVSDGTGSPDLVIRSPTVDNISVVTGGSFTFSATVFNMGDGSAPATTARYYQSTNATITLDDEEVVSTNVGAIPGGASSDVETLLTAPSETGTYYYGVCVDAVADETDTGNNCSAAVQVDVTDEDPEADSYCRPNDTIQPGERCDIYDRDHHFEVRTSGTGCYLGPGLSLCGGSSVNYRNVTINNVTINFVAARNSDNSWTISEVQPVPPN